MGEEALAEAELAVRLNPNYPDAYNQLGVVYLEKGKAQEAIGEFQKARALDQDNPNYLRNLVAACQKAGNYKEALGLYRELSSRPRSLLSLNY
jgi:tetratricopeptide (TPR) repeat protein